MSDYSEVAAAQRDELESTAQEGFWDAISDACDLALNFPVEAQNRSTAVVTTSVSVVFRLPVVGCPPYKVFWSQNSGAPRLEAVFPHP